jgi:hypothetical protein
LFVGTDAIDAGVIILALGTQVTSLQRMVYVRRILAEREREEPS